MWKRLHRSIRAIGQTTYNVSGNAMLKTSTIIVVILDESGSMASKKTDVLGGFNDFIEEQKKIDSDDARLFTVKFNNRVSILHKGIPIADVPQLTSQSYMPGGGTALCDAIAEGVRLAENNKKSQDRVICVIMTDGEENSSRDTTEQEVSDIIREHEELGDWTFVYIGENPERWAQDVGMSARNTLQYDHVDVRSNLSQLGDGMRAMRSSSSMHSTDFFSKLYSIQY